VQRTNGHPQRYGKCGGPTAAQAGGTGSALHKPFRCNTKNSAFYRAVHSSVS